jgi:hypothetical protein
VRADPQASDATHRPAVYVIVDGPLGDAPGATRLTTRAILSRSIHAGLNHFLRTTLELTAATAQLQGATLHYAAVPAAYPHMDAFDFRAATMRPLFSYADECAQAGRLWTAFQHGEAVVESPATASRGVPCPADDTYIGRLASR